MLRSFRTATERCVMLAGRALVIVAVWGTAGTQAAPTIRPLTPVITGHRVGGMAVDSTGNIYAADFGDEVWKIALDGQRSVLGAGMYGTSGNAVDADGSVLQASCYGNTIVKFRRDSRRTTVAEDPKLKCPIGVAVDGTTGDVYVASCSGNAILKIRGGIVSTFAISPLFKCPNGLVFGPAGSLYSVNFRDNRMLRTAPSGTVSEFATVSTNGLGHLCFMKDRFYVTAYQSHELYEVTLKREVRRVLGDGQRGTVETAPTTQQLSFPNGVACDPWAKRLYINEYLSTSPAALRPQSIVRVVELEGEQAK